MMEEFIIMKGNNNAGKSAAKKNQSLSQAQARAILTGQRQGSGTFGIFGKYEMIPVLFAIVVIPLIVVAVYYDSGINGKAWFEGGQKFDVFLIMKGYFLYAVSIIMAIVTAFLLADDDRRARLKSGKKWLIPLGIYALLAIISTIASPYRSTGLSAIGGYEQHESLWVILCYCMVLTYTFLVVTDENCVQILKVALGILTCILSLLGISQITGYDFFESPLGKALIVPASFENYEQLRQSLSFTFSGSGNHQVYLTLYNPNYVGMYASLVLPICAILIISSKQVWKKIYWGLMFVGTFLCAMGCGSKTFVFSFIISIIIAAVFYRKQLKNGWPVLVGLVAVLVVAGGLYFKSINTNVIDYVKNAVTTKSTGDLLENVEFSEDCATITYNGFSFDAAFDETSESPSIILTAKDGSTINTSLNSDDGFIYPDNDKLSGVKFKYEDMTDRAGDSFTCIEMYTPSTSALQHVFTFAKVNGKYTYITAIGEPDEIYNAPSVIFTDSPQFASGRGYIWSRTIPLLAKHIVLGGGADSYTEVFPQNDYLGKITSGYASLIITKPHNMYLQTGVNEGVLALICELAIFVIYMIQSGKLYFKADLTDSLTAFGFGINLGVIGYIFAGLLNDSCLALAPLFWIILGAGFGVNCIVKDRMNA